MLLKACGYNKTFIDNMQCPGKANYSDLPYPGYPNKIVSSKNTELKQAMLKLNTTFMLQR